VAINARVSISLVDIPIIDDTPLQVLQALCRLKLTPA
jgi:hypothetical protein